jgi:molybdate transport system substrate-binding protein
VFWTVRPGVGVADVAAAVRSPAVVKLAVANVETAPYGRAAKQALQRLGAWEEALPKLVVGENISQAAQFVETGNADAGFVALSIVVLPRLKERGLWKELPPSLYDPLEQCAVLTVRGSANPAAARYVTFLKCPAARRILESFGYGIPAAL